MVSESSRNKMKLSGPRRGFHFRQLACHLWRDLGGCASHRAAESDWAGPCAGASNGMGQLELLLCNYDDQTIRDQVDALVASGMRDLRYRYVIIQECSAPTG